MSPGPIWRCMGVRETPSARFGFNSSNRRSSKSPPVVEIADDADLMTGGGLRLGQVAHVPEDAPDRRPKAVDDPQFLGHGLPAVID